MLFTESQLVSANTSSLNKIMNEAVWIEPASIEITPVTAAVVENSTIGTPVVHFADVERLSEEVSCSYDEAVQAIAEANGVSNVAVAIPEWKLVENTDLINQVSNVVLVPMSESNIYKQFVTVCVESYVATGDTDYMAPFFCESAEAAALLIEAKAKKKAAEGQPQYASDDDKKSESIMKTVGTKLEAAKNWTADKLQRFYTALSDMYSKYKAKAEEIGNDPNALKWKKVVAFIGRAISKVVELLHKMVPNKVGMDKARADKKAEADAAAAKKQAAEADAVA